MVPALIEDEEDSGSYRGVILPPMGGGRLVLGMQYAGACRYGNVKSAKCIEK